MDVAQIVILIAYGSLLLELVVFPIPSEASTYQIFFEAAPDGRSTSEADALERARERAPWVKFVRFFLPTALGVLLFLVPPVAAFWPELTRYLGPLTGLETPGMRSTGLFVILLGRAITFTSVLQLRRHKEIDLASLGWFRFSRNPGLVGMYVFYLGNCLAFPCLALFVGFFPYVLNMHTRVLMEESHLSRRLGSPYRDYLRRVPRYLFVGTSK